MLGKNSITLLLRAASVCMMLVILSGCSESCEKYLFESPQLPSDKLKKVYPPLPNYQERQYYLCLLKKMGVQIIRVGQTWTFVLPSDALFDNDTAEIEPKYLSVLANIGDFIKTYHTITVTVQAFSDKPIEEIRTKFGTITETLTQAQAESVLEVLTEQDINARLIYAEGRGAKDSIAWDGSKMGRYLNRRVEIHFRYYHDDTAWY